MKKTKSIIHKIGSATVKTGVIVGGTIIESYQKIDPDVIRHLLHVPLLSYSLFVSRHEKIDPGKPDGHPPLIFVHGLGGNRGNFLLMSWYLWLLGRKRSYKIHFDSGQSVQDMTTALARFIQDVRKVTHQRQVEIVAHSLGGLVARLAIRKYRLAHQVKTLITLGSPHHGTYSARYANTVITRDIRPNSKLIKELEKQPWPKGVRGVTFWSRSDLLVLPSESAVMDGTVQIEVTPFTHYSYLIDPKSWAAVGRVLENR
jgi:pimeloyl-ACP methyl ester carboxylesterase